MKKLMRTWNLAPIWQTTMAAWLCLSSPPAWSQNQPYQSGPPETPAAQNYAQPEYSGLPAENQAAAQTENQYSNSAPPQYNNQTYDRQPVFTTPNAYEQPSGSEGGYSPSYNRYQQNFYRPQSGWLYPRPQSSTVPSGLVIPITLDTSISTQAAKPGDYIQAHIGQNITLGGTGYIPGGTVVSGEVSAAKSGRWAERSGLLSIDFNQFRLPNGLLIPVSAHLIGNIGNYKQKGNGTYRGEGWGTKLLNFGLRSGLGAGLGAGLGCAVGGISGGGSGVGSGAWSGMAMGAGMGALDSLVLRRGRDVIIHAGTPMQLQIDQPLEIPGPSPGPGPGYSQQGVL